MAHIPSRAIVTTTDLPLYLKCADAFLGVEYLPEYLEPRLERILSILEDGPADDAEPIILAWLAESVKRPRVEFVNGGNSRILDSEQRHPANAVPSGICLQDSLVGKVAINSRSVIMHTNLTIDLRVNYP
jgi:hypothetical protein